MTVTTQLVQRIPHLRRFARALTGSQAGGDAYVAATLETLAADPGSLPAKSSPQVSLYALFCQIWRTVDVNHRVEPVPAPWEIKADMRLASLVPEERMVFLLRVLEGFSIDETGEILGLNARKVTELMERANADIAAQLSSRVLIVEDEPLIALDLERIVTELGHEVAAIARTHREATAALERERPGLILADIQLADGSSGINAVNDILTDHPVPVIFITAYPEHLLTGEGPEPTFLIAKPYDPAVVKAMISQVLFFQQNASRRKVA
jgi:DNA-directed RNA polymerase specialized sigma24 family protein/CheY-like chemotaxis protein